MLTKEVIVQYKGRYVSIGEVVEKEGIDENKFIKRLRRFRKWGDPDAVNKAIWAVKNGIGDARIVYYEGDYHTLAYVARKTGLRQERLLYRAKRGLDGDELFEEGRPSCEHWSADMYCEKFKKCREEFLKYFDIKPKKEFNIEYKVVYTERTGACKYQCVKTIKYEDYLKFKETHEDVRIIERKKKRNV